MNSDLNRKEIIQLIANRTDRIIDLRGVQFKDVDFSELGIDNVNFRKAKFENCVFENNIDNSEFDSSFVNCEVGLNGKKVKSGNIEILGGKVKSLYFNECDKISEVKIRGIETMKYSPNGISFHNSTFGDIRVYDSSIYSSMIDEGSSTFSLYLSFTERLHFEACEIDFRGQNSQINTLTFNKSNIVFFELYECELKNPLRVFDCDISKVSFKRCKITHEIANQLNNLGVTHLDSIIVD